MARRLRLALGLAAAAVLAAPPPALAQSARPSPAQVVALAMRGGRTPFSGVREQQVIRQDMVLHARAKVSYKGPSDYAIAVEAPDKIQGLTLGLAADRFTALFPREKLAFVSDGPAGTDEAKDLVMGRLTDNPALLTRNYTLQVAPEQDPVALYPCYKLTLEPKAGFGPNQPPGRRVWIATETGDVMREERYWGPDAPSYFQSRYERYGRSGVSVPALTPPKETSTLKLARGTANALVRYPSVEAARQAGKAVQAPTRLPEGFALRAVDVLSLYGTDIVLLRYTDGLNSCTVTYRPKPNAFLTLVAGAFALSLVDKISQLSFHAPNNYAVVEKGDMLIYAYGDLWAENLRATAASVPLPTPAAPAR